MSFQMRKLVKIHEIPATDVPDTARTDDREIVIQQIKTSLEKYNKFQSDGNFALKDIHKLDTKLETEIQSTYRSEYDLNTIANTPRENKIIMDLKNTRMIKLLLMQLQQLLMAFKTANGELTPDL